MIARPQADLLNLLPLAPAAQTAPALQTLGAQAPRFDAVLLEAVKESKTFSFQGDFEALNPKVLKALEVALGQLSRLPLEQLRQAATKGLSPAMTAAVEQAGKDLRLDGPQASQLDTLVQAVLPRLSEQAVARTMVQATQVTLERPGLVSGPQGGDPVAPPRPRVPVIAPAIAPSPEVVAFLPHVTEERPRPELEAPQTVALVAAMQGPVLISTRTDAGADQGAAPSPIAATRSVQPQGRTIVLASSEAAPAAQPLSVVPRAEVTAQFVPAAEAMVPSGKAAPRPSSFLEALVPASPVIRVAASAPQPPAVLAEAQPGVEDEVRQASAGTVRPRVLTVASAQAAQPQTPAARTVPAEGAPALPAPATVGSANIDPSPTQGATVSAAAPRSSAEPEAPQPAASGPQPERASAPASRPAYANPVARDLDVSVAPMTAPLNVDEDSVVTLRGGDARPSAPRSGAPVQTTLGLRGSEPSPQASVREAPSTSGQALHTPGEQAQAGTRSAQPVAVPSAQAVGTQPSTAATPNVVPQPNADVQAAAPAPAAPVTIAASGSTPPAAASQVQGQATLPPEMAVVAATPTQVSAPSGSVVPAQAAAAPVEAQASTPSSPAARQPRAEETAGEAPAARVAWRPLQNDGPNLEGRRFSDADVRELAMQAVRDLGLRESVLKQVSEAVAGASRDVSRLVIKLKPESLGAVEVELKVEGGRLVARLVTSQAEVRDVLATNLATFRQNLENQGLSVRELSVAVKAETNQQQGQPQQQSQPSWLPDLKKQLSQAAQNAVVLPQVFVPSGPAPRFSAVA